MFKQYIVLMVMGGLSALALPPIYGLPILCITFSYFLNVHDRLASIKQACFAGWWFGLGYFTAGLYWISIALWVDIEQFWWLVPFALFGIPTVLALYSAMISGVLYRLAPKTFSKYLGFACLWVLAEWLRGWMFTGFPWNILGSVWSFSDTMLQITSVTGLLGLSFLTCLLAGIPYVYRHISRPNNIKIMVGVLILSVVVLLFGMVRLHQAGPTLYHKQQVIRVVQGNIQQDLKWDPQLQSENLQAYIDLSQKPSTLSDAITHIIWPESAVPYLYSGQHDELYDVLQSLVPQNGALMTGMVRAKRNSFGEISALYNSFVAFNDNKTVSMYDKSHLVPFGEYVPLRRWLPSIFKKVTSGFTDFSAGSHYQTITVEGLSSVRPLVCYEAIFPDELFQLDRNQDTASLLLNITNDGWYGVSSGPYQHLQAARVRAIEQGMPLVRSANTGISAVVDAYGRIVVTTSIMQKTFVDSYIPLPLDAKTIYARYGSFIVIVPITLFFLFSIFQNSRKRGNIAKS